MAATEGGRAARFLAALAAVGCAQQVAAQEFPPQRASIGFHVYADDDGLTVLHPSASVVAGRDWQAQVDYDADVITAATVDVRTSASVRPFEETRHGLAVALRRAHARGLWGVSAATSQSPDYGSYTVGVDATLEDARRRDTWSVDLRGSHAWVGRVGDLHPLGHLQSLGGSLTWTRVLSARLVLDLSGALEWRHGYQAHPYRFVVVVGPGQDRLALPEAVPHTRLRGALAGRLRVALTPRLFAHARYRLHADDWGVAGHTVGLDLRVAPSPRVEVGIVSHFLVQRGASFRRSTYETYPDVPTLRTHDREIAAGFSGRALLVLRWVFAELRALRLSFGARGGFLYYRYFDTPLLPERRGLIVGVSLTGELS